MREKKIKTARWKLLAGKILVFAVALLICVVVAELGLRLLAPQNTEPHPRGLYEIDPELGFVLAAQVAGVNRSPEWETHVRTSTLGLRERELATKEPGERRLLVLGDSFTFGAGVEAEEAYPRQIEQALADLGIPNVNVINAGVPGYGTRHEAIWCERLTKQVQPDAILVGFFVNDFADNLSLNEFEVIDGYLVTKSVHGSRVVLTERLGIPPEVKIWVRTRSHLYTLLANGWTAALVSVGMAETSEMFEIYRQDPTQATLLAVETTGVALARLKACTAADVPVALVFINDGRVMTELGGKAGYRISRPAEILRELAAAEGVAVLDLSEVFRNRGELYFPVDGHWNADGHRVAGRAIAESIVGGELSHVASEALNEK